MAAAYTFLACLVLVHGQPFNVTNPPASSTESSVPIPCVSVRKLFGFCVTRGRCDYGTAAIDFTLYAPRGYIRTCAADKVCCPTDYIAADTQTESNRSNRKRPKEDEDMSDDDDSNLEDY